MAQAPKKAKKAAKTAASKTKTPHPSAQTSSTSARNPLMVPLMIGAVLVGVVLGMMVNNGSGQDTANGDIDAQIEAYIQNNAGEIIDALNTHMREKVENEREQVLNLVRANDGKTVLGNPDGDVTVYEFSDYNCGYCKRAFNDVMAAIEEDGNIRLVVKEFPILAPSSRMAAQLSMAAAELGRFEEFHTALMQWQGALDDAAFTQITDNLGIDMNELAKIIAKGEIDASLDEIQSIAQQLNISGTPGFVIGNEIVPGYIPKEQILDIVRTARKG